MTYDLARTKKRSIGRCELCGTFDNFLERHHISYKPEKTRRLCHSCHFTAHYYPERLSHIQKVILLNKVMTLKEAFTFATRYAKDRVKLAKAFAPSRRKAIREAQKSSNPKTIKTKNIDVVKSKQSRNSHS